MFASLAPARRRLLLALLAVAAAAAVTIGLVAATSGGHARAIIDRNHPGPVLLVPGYGGSETGLDVLATRLRAAGRTVDVVHLPDNAQGDLGVQARALGAAARAAASGASSVDIVGYSAGGVVARLWVRDYGGAALARRIVTLGSPQHGTQLAALGALVPSVCPTACRQLTPDSTLLAALNAGDETPAGPTFVSIWSTDDEVVLPPDSARLAGALNITVQNVCAGTHIEHSDLPTNSIVESMVALELGAGAPVPLSPADCRRLSS
jgi:triacylglycerol esterase/lipase EstA (alpha/beta hydrolase family)